MRNCGAWYSGESNVSDLQIPWHENKLGTRELILDSRLLANTLVTYILVYNCTIKKTINAKIQTETTNNANKETDKYTMACNINK